MVNGRAANGLGVWNRASLAAWDDRVRPEAPQIAPSVGLNRLPVVEDCNYCFCNPPEPVNACIAERWAGR
jgi:hypothetical protein